MEDPFVSWYGHPRNTQKIHKVFKDRIVVETLSIPRERVRDRRK